MQILPQKPRLRKEIDALIIVAIVLLVGVGAYGLGRLSALEEAKSAITIHAPGTDQLASPVPALPNGKPIDGNTIANGENYVASKSGTKYYLPTCAGAKNISDANKVWFATKEQAEAAGYQPGSNCKGL